jgi:hypothetical protein
MPAPLRPPLWARWAISLGVGLILLLALVLFVEHNNNNSEATQSPAAVARANREAAVVVAQDQAPHVTVVASGTGARAAIVKAVRGDMTQLVNTGVVGGPLTRVGCARTGAHAGPHAGPLAFRCTAVAAGVNYPFLGVVDLHARRVTYCKRDEPPVPSLNIPVSPRCRS